MSLYFLSMLISQNSGGIKKSAFSEADNNLSCHHIPRRPVKLPSVPSCQLFACSRLLQMSDTCIHLSYFIMLLFVWIFFSSQLLSDLLASIIYCCTCCAGESAACWSSANVALASVEVYWSMKERGHRRAVQTSCSPMEIDCPCFQRTC